MKRLILAASATVLMSGCASSALSIFNKDSFYEKGLSVTQKGEIYQSMELKALVTATDLVAIDPKTYGDAQRYFVGIYIPNDRDDKCCWGLKNPDITISLNDGVKPISVEELDRENMLVKKLPAVNNWSKYYIVSFPLQAKEETRRILKVERLNAGTVALSF